MASLALKVYLPGLVSNLESLFLIIILEHVAVIKVRILLEAKCGVPCVELLLAPGEADNLAILGIGGHPYHVFEARTGAVLLMISCNRAAMLRSGSCISLIAASTAFFSAALSLLARSSAFNSLPVPSWRRVRRL